MFRLNPDEWQGIICAGTLTAVLTQYAPWYVWLPTLLGGCLLGLVAYAIASVAQSTPDYRLRRKARIEDKA